MKREPNQRSTRRLIVADQNTGRIAYLYSHEQTTKYMPHWRTGKPRECWRPIEVTPTHMVRVFWVAGDDSLSEWMPDNDARIVRPDEAFLLINAIRSSWLSACRG